MIGEGFSSVGIRLLERNSDFTLLANEKEKRLQAVIVDTVAPGGWCPLRFAAEKGKNVRRDIYNIGR